MAEAREEIAREREKMREEMDEERERRREELAEEQQRRRREPERERERRARAQLDRQWYAPTLRWEWRIGQGRVESKFRGE